MLMLLSPRDMEINRSHLQILKKTRKFILKSAFIVPQYVYYEFAMLYVKRNKKDLERETFEKVISMPIEKSLRFKKYSTK